MLTVAEAVERVIGGAQPLAAERTPLLDALGRVLASPVVAPLTLPPWDNSAMDGYAVRAADIDGASSPHSSRRGELPRMNSSFATAAVSRAMTICRQAHSCAS